MAQLKMEPPAAHPKEVVVTALKKGLDGGVSGAAAMTIQVIFSPGSIPFIGTLFPRTAHKVDKVNVYTTVYLFTLCIFVVGSTFDNFLLIFWNLLELMIPIVADLN
jgi:hypothetical protein